MLGFWIPGASPLAAAVAAGAAGLACASSRDDRAVDALRDHPRGLEGPWQVRGRLGRDPEATGYGSSVDADIEAIHVDGGWRPASLRARVSVFEPAPTATWKAGDRFEAFLRFRLDRPAANPGIAPRPRLRPAGIALRASLKSYLQLRAREPEHVTGRSAFVRLRAAIRAASELRFPRHDATVRALLLGERGALPGTLTAVMARAGLVHLLAISGLHVGLLVGAAFGLARCAGAPRPVAAAAAGAALLILPAIVVGRPPARRAGLMAAIALSGVVRGRRQRALDALALALLVVTLIEPWSVRDLGLQLSAVATAGILLIGPVLDRSALRRLPGARLLCLSASAQLAVAPLLAITSHRVPTAGLVANVVGVPLLGLALATVIGTLVLDSVGLAALASASALAGNAALDALAHLGRIAERVGGLGWVVPAGRLPALGVYTAALLMLAGSVRVRTAGAVLFVAASLAATRPVSAPRSLRFVALDVGQGDALLVRTPSGENVLVDTGGSPGTGFDTGTAIVAPALRAAGIGELDAVAISHLHADHVGGLAGLLRDTVVRSVWTGPLEPTSSAASRLRRDVVGLPHVTLAAGHSRARGTCIWRALHPDPDWLRRREAGFNDSSLVLEVACDRRAVLLTGDIEGPAEWALSSVADGPRARRPAPGLPAALTVLKIAHHGSTTSSGAAFLDRVEPRHGIVSVGWNNRFGLPRAEVLARLRARGIAVYRTDRDGAITVDLGDRVRVRGERWSSGRGG